VGVTFSHEYQAQWRDMDFNQHMANSAFLDYAANTRFRFLESMGFTPATFAARQLGPVILEDHLVYRHEIRMLESFTVDYQSVANSSDGKRFKVRNRFTNGEGVRCATVESIGVWFDLAARRAIVPPADLHEAFARLERADDYQEWD
jgi:acyl-CoA thioester hydrolase